MGLISKSQLTACMNELGFHPIPEYISAIVHATNRSFDNTDYGRNMAAMFLAQLTHESGGFRYIEETRYAGKHRSPYGEGEPGKSYHGRGFIMLSWDYNYRDASKGLGRGLELYRRPELVAQDPALGAEVSVWFWKTRVETAHGVSSGRHFGYTTKAINGGVECCGHNEDQSRNRYRYYKLIARNMGVSNLADERGCYN